MNLSVRTKAVIYTVCIVFITSIISTIGVSWLIVRQTHQQNQKRLQAALASFERTFAEVPRTLEHQFTTFLNLKSLAVQMLETIQSGWTLEVGLDYIGHFSKFEELFVRNEAIERFALYIAPKFQGEERLALYFDQTLGDLILVEDDQHVRRREFDRIAIDNPQLFPLIYTPSQQYALHVKHGKLYLIAHLEYAVDPFETGQPIHLGTFVFEKALQLELPDLEQEMGVRLNLYDASGTLGMGTVRLPDLNLDATLFSKEHTIRQLTDTRGQGYDALLVPLTYYNLIVGYAAVSISHAETTRNIQETVILLVSITFAIILVVFFLSSILIAAWSRRIIRLTNASWNITKGDLDQEIDADGTDELGTLARSFVHMRDEIKMKIAALQAEIEERQQAEAALRETEARYRELADSISDVFFALNAELRYTYWNQASERLTGIPAHAALGRSLYDLFPDVKGTPLAQCYLDALTTKQPQHIENLYRLGAQDFIFDITAYPTAQGIAVFAKDITARKQAEQELHNHRDHLEELIKQRTAELANERNLLRTLIDNMPDLILIKDVESRFLALNPALARLMGAATPDDLLGKTDFDFYPQDIAQLYYTREQAILTSGQPSLNQEELHIDPDTGEDRWFLATKIPFRDQQGVIRGLVGISRDITEHKQLEEELKQHQDHLEELVKERTTELITANEHLRQEIAERQRAEEEIHTLNAELERRVHERTAKLETANKELKDFAYVVSHDLKAPLRGISRLAHWLTEDYANVIDDKGKEMAHLLIGRVKRMDTLIDGILEYSRIGRIMGQSVHIDLNHLLPEVIDTLAPPEHIKVRIENELPVIVGDRTRVLQVFQNLIGNAIKFLDKPTGEIRIGSMPEESNWKFWVTDNGPGIEERHYERIFQIFQTLTPRDEQENTGVGLAIVKKIVEFYGGKIWVESTIGKGSTFLFTLPKSVT